VSARRRAVRAWAASRPCCPRWHASHGSPASDAAARARRARAGGRLPHWRHRGHAGEHRGVQAAPAGLGRLCVQERRDVERDVQYARARDRRPLRRSASACPPNTMWGYFMGRDARRRACGSAGVLQGSAGMLGSTACVWVAWAPQQPGAQDRLTRARPVIDATERLHPLPGALPVALRPAQRACMLPRRWPAAACTHTTLQHSGSGAAQAATASVAAPRGC